MVLKVVIVTSSCGGVLIAAKAVEEVVKKRFPSAECGIITIDDLWPGRSLRCYEHYLMIAREGCCKIIWCLTSLQKLIIGFYKNHFVKELTSKIFAKNLSPSLIISTVPLVNGALLEIAEEANIPLFVISADMDTDLFAQRWPKREIVAPHRFGVFYNCPDIVAKINPALDKTKLIFTGGFARGEFFKQYSAEEKKRFRKELNLPQNRDVISLMMGSLGGNQIWHYVKRIMTGDKEGEFSHSAHFVVFCAKNKALKEKLQKLAEKKLYQKTQDDLFFSPSGMMSFSFMGYSDSVHKVFALSKGLITKPGAASLSEAFSQNLPLIIDAIKGQFPWEKMNGKVVMQYGLGLPLRKINELPRLINDHFLNEQGNDAIRKRHLLFKTKLCGNVSFQESVGETVATLLAETTHR